MKEDLERLLAEEPTLTPRPGFTEQVMDAVRAEPAPPPPIAFPLRVAVIAASILLATAAGGAALVVTRSVPTLHSLPSGTTALVAAACVVSLLLSLAPLVVRGAVTRTL